MIPGVAACETRALGTKQMIEIRFNRRCPKYKSFSNFSRHPIVVKGTEWPTVEHYFQAQKFLTKERIELIRLTSSPAKARKLGTEIGHPIRPDWDEIRNDVMFEALLAKFQQHPEIAKLLLSTGDALLVENNPFDCTESEFLGIIAC